MMEGEVITELESISPVQHGRRFVEYDPKCTNQFGGIDKLMETQGFVKTKTQVSTRERPIRTVAAMP